MDIALPAIIVFLIVIPGFIFRAQFKRAEQETFDFSPFGRVVGQAFLWALILHAAWLLVSWLFCDTTLNLTVLLELLTSPTPSTLKHVSDDIIKITYYFSTLYVFCWLAPPFFREQIVKYRLDRTGSRMGWLLRFDAPWYYLLQGADQITAPDLIYASAIVEVGDQAILYRGILVDFIVDRNDGKLDRLILRNVYRWKLSEFDEAKAKVNFKTAVIEAGKLIEGDIFVISYDETVTLNIDYAYLTRG